MTDYGVRRAVRRLLASLGVLVGATLAAAMVTAAMAN